eukprot:5629040-Pyramimonas_sp.AAC.1
MNDATKDASNVDAHAGVDDAGNDDDAVDANDCDDDADDDGDDDDEDDEADDEGEGAVVGGAS